jgi:hypothetical protein
LKELQPKKQLELERGQGSPHWSRVIMMAQNWTRVLGMELMKTAVLLELDLMEMVILLVLERQQDDMMVKVYWPVEMETLMAPVMDLETW